MIERTAQEWFSTRDCSFAGCVEVSEHGREFCVDHRGAQVKLVRVVASEHGRWTREEIIRSIRSYALAHGVAPTGDEWEHADPFDVRPTERAVRNAFGTWANAVEAAGLPRPSKGRRIPIPTAVLDEIRSAA